MNDIDARLRWVLAIALTSIIIGGTANLMMDQTGDVALVTDTNRSPR